MEFRAFYNTRCAASNFWNPVMETMPRQQLDALHLGRLRKLVAHAYDHCPLYRQLYDAAGVKPDDIKTLDDFARRLPTVSKADLAGAQEAQPPYGDAMGLPEDDLLFRFQDQADGEPIFEIPVSYHGAMRSGEPWAHLFWAAGLRADALVYFPFDWNIKFGLWSAYFGVRRLGATMLSGGGLDWKARLRQIEQLRPQALLTTASEALTLSDIANQEGINLRDLSVRSIFTHSASQLTDNARRQAIEETWNAKVYEVYARDEVGVIAVGFHSREGLHAVEDCGYSLILDESENATPDGAAGELVYTSYAQLAQPVIKYHTGDLVEAHRRPSPDGRTWIFFKGGLLGRRDAASTTI